MNKTFRIAIILAAGTVALAGYGVAQLSESPAKTKEWRTRYLTAGLDMQTGTKPGEVNAHTRFHKAMQEAVGNHARTTFIAGLTLDDSSATNREETALILMQNQKLIEQNDEIIQLLKQLK